jgi:hypothetical protein
VRSTSFCSSFFQPLTRLETKLRNADKIRKMHEDDPSLRIDKGLAKHSDNQQAFPHCGYMLIRYCRSGAWWPNHHMTFEARERRLALDLSPLKLFPLCWSSPTCLPAIPSFTVRLRVLRLLPILSCVHRSSTEVFVGT